MGILWAPYFSVYEEIKNETLIPVLPQESSPDINLYAICPKSTVDEQKINLLLNFFCEKALSENIATSFIDGNN